MPHPAPTLKGQTMSQIPTVAAVTLAERIENETASSDDFVNLVNLLAEQGAGCVSVGFEIGRAQGFFVAEEYEIAAEIMREVADELTPQADAPAT